MAIMAEIIFLNLEKTDSNFVDCVYNQKSDLRRIVRRMPVAARPSVKYVNATDEIGIHNTIVSATKILHIAGHGSYFGTIASSGSKSGPQLHRLKKFADYLESRNEYLDLDCVILDSCYSAGLPWRIQLQRLIGPKREMIIIGSSLGLPFSQAEEFFANFYGALLAKKLPTRKTALFERIYDSFNEAQGNYISEHDWWSKLRITTLRNDQN